LPIAERRQRLIKLLGLDECALAALAPERGLSAEQADLMTENVVGVLGIPLGVCANLRVDGVDRVIPMATEEPSVIAAASHAANLLRVGRGIVTEVAEPIMEGQIQVLDVPDLERAEEAIASARTELLGEGNRLHPNLVAAGGGVRDISVKRLVPMGPEDPLGTMLVVHVLVDVREAMGANVINSLCEELAPRIAALTCGRVRLRILSNLCDRRTVTVIGAIPLAALAGKDDQLDAADAEVASGIVEASVFAERDPHRAATHNKGIMNGVDAVLLALGQDFRAVEAGAHAFAAQRGRYQPLARWRVVGDRLIGHLVMPMAVGVVGGTLRAHPTVRAALALARVSSAADLASVAAAVGLCQNLGALRALAAEGIQNGHLRMHARHVCAEAGARGADIDRAARILAAQRRVNVEAAREVLMVMQAEDSEVAS
jgi:hydroxymethylglutaryl-CoA reductase